jgi:hypothetical protein
VDRGPPFLDRAVDHGPWFLDRAVDHGPPFLDQAVTAAPGPGSGSPLLDRAVDRRSWTADRRPFVKHHGQPRNTATRDRADEVDLRARIKLYQAWADVHPHGRRDPEPGTLVGLQGTYVGLPNPCGDRPSGPPHAPTLCRVSTTGLASIG